MTNRRQPGFHAPCFVGHCEFVIEESCYQFPAMGEKSFPAQIVEDSGDVDNVRDFDLGKVMQGDHIRHEFAIHNSTIEAITITAIHKSCGCQALELEEGTVVPAGKVLKFGYGMASSVTGLHRAKLIVVTDSAEASFREIIITLQADIVAVVTPTPSIVQYGRISQGQAKSQQIRLTAIDSEVLTGFRGATVIYGRVICAVAEQSAEAVVINVELPGTAPLGTINDSIILRFDRGDRQPLSLIVPIQGHVIPSNGA